MISAPAKKYLGRVLKDNIWAQENLEADEGLPQKLFTMEVRRTRSIASAARTEDDRPHSQKVVSISNVLAGDT